MFPLVKIGVPATEVMGGKVVMFMSPVLSAIRPPQPAELEPLETDVCH